MRPGPAPVLVADVALADIASHDEYFLGREEGSGFAPTHDRHPCISSWRAGLGREFPPQPGTLQAMRSNDASVAARAATVAARALAFVRLIHFEGTAFEFLAVQGLDGPRSIGVRHLDEPEPAWTVGLAVRDYRDFVDRSVRREQRTQGVFGSGEGKISNEKFGHLGITHRQETDKGRSAASWFGDASEVAGSGPGRAPPERGGIRQTRPKITSHRHHTAMYVWLPAYRDLAVLAAVTAPVPAMLRGRRFPAQALDPA